MTPPPRKVALLLPNLTLGGAERQAVELALRLPGFGWQPVVMAAEPQGPQRERFAAAGIAVHDIGTEFWRPKWSPGFWRNLRASIDRIAGICRSEQVSVLQSFLFWQNCIAVPAGRKAGVPVITGRRNTGEFKDRRPHYQWIENRANRDTAAVVCNSEAVRADAVRRERIDPARLRVIPNGVDVEHFVRATAKPLAQLHPELAGGSFIVGTIGNLKRQKRHDRFLRIMAGAHKLNPAIRGVIVGRDLGELASLEKLRDELGLRDVVAFAGGTDDPAGYLRAFDLFLLTSDHEGMPNVVLEAMAARCPVMAMAIPALVEVMPEGTGFYFDPVPRMLLESVKDGGDALPLPQEVAASMKIAGLIAKPDLLRATADEAFEHVKSGFSMEAMAGEYAALYEKLAEGASRG